MLISLLKRQIPAVQKKAKRILCGGAWNGFFDGEEAMSKYLIFKAGQVLLTRKNGADIGFKIKKAAAPKFDR